MTTSYNIKRRRDALDDGGVDGDDGGDDAHNHQKRKFVSILKNLSIKDEVSDERVDESKDSDDAYDMSDIVNTSDNGINNYHSGIYGLLCIENKKRFNYAVDRLVDNLLRKSHRKSLHNNSRDDTFTTSKSELDFYFPPSIGPRPCDDHAISLFVDDNQFKLHLHNTQKINRNNYNDKNDKNDKMLYSSFCQPQLSRQTHSGHVSHMDWGMEERKISLNDLMSCDDTSFDHDNNENCSNCNENDDAIDIYY